VIELPVDPNARNINFGLLMPGTGTAWFDDLTIELDGEPYVDPALFDLGFESRSPVGFYTGGHGYTVALDPTVAHGGTQSLRMSKNAAQSTSTSVDRAKKFRPLTAAFGLRRRRANALACSGHQGIKVPMQMRSRLVQRLGIFFQPADHQRSFER
jgi:hypothetical protein